MLINAFIAYHSLVTGKYLLNSYHLTNISAQYICLLHLNVPQLPWKY